MAEQHNAMTFGRIMALFMAAIVTCLLLVFIIKKCGGRRIPDDPLAEQRVELTQAIQIVGTPLLEGPHELARDFNEENARFRSIYQERGHQFKNAELTKDWTAIQTHAETGVLTLRRIAEVDGTPIATNEYDKAGDQLGEAIWQGLQKMGNHAALATDLLQTETSLNQSIASLQQVANSLTVNHLPSAISIRYLPSWQGNYRNDKLWLTNTSGATIPHASIIANVKMSDGTTITHVHYVDQWEPNKTLGAYYPYKATEYAQAQTSDHPTRVDVSLYLPNGTATATYELTQQVWDSIIKDYAANLHITGTLLLPYQEEESNEVKNTGVELLPSGLYTLPVDSIDITTTWPDGSVRNYSGSWERGKTLAMEKLPIRVPELNFDQSGAVPSRESWTVVPKCTRVTLHLSGTTYTPPIDGLYCDPSTP